MVTFILNQNLLGRISYFNSSFIKILNQLKDYECGQYPLVPMLYKINITFITE